MSRSRSGAFSGNEEFDRKEEAGVIAIIAATAIQKIHRGFAARRTYKLDYLSDAQLSGHHVMPKGNDPQDMIDRIGVSTNKRIAIVGTSTLRSVEMACKITQPGSPIPKIYIVDNSRDVHQFWVAIKKVFEDASSEADVAQLISQEVYTLPIYLKNHHRGTFNEHSKYYSFLEINTLLDTLFETYGFDRVRSIIRATVPIKGDWSDTDLFRKIHNIATTNGAEELIAYPSNILACLGPSCPCGSANCAAPHGKIINSINVLQPSLSVFTDRCPTHGVPENSFIAKGLVTIPEVEEAFYSHRGSRDGLDPFEAMLLIQLLRGELRVGTTARTQPTRSQLGLAGALTGQQTNGRSRDTTNGGLSALASELSFPCR